MYKFIQITLISFFALFTQNALAEILKFEAYPGTSQYTQFYPDLDLHQIEKIKITASTSNLYPYRTDITRLDLVFPNATDLTVTNLSYDGQMYRGLVNGAWVYKQIMVEVEAPELLTADINVRIRLYVVDQVSSVNNPTLSYGLQMFDTSGFLVDVTPNKIVDVTTFKVDQKNLTLRLYQRPVADSTGQGFKVNATWFGHGEASFVLGGGVAPGLKAIGLVVDTQTLPDGTQQHFVSINFSDNGGPVSTTLPEDIRPYLDAHFPVLPQ